MKYFILLGNLCGLAEEEGCREPLWFLPLEARLGLLLIRALMAAVNKKADIAAEEQHKENLLYFLQMLPCFMHVRKKRRHTRSLIEMRFTFSPSDLNLLTI